jgi:thiol-disulfide isomerase/thioredoxin
LVTLLFVKKDFSGKNNCITDALQYVSYPPFRRLTLDIRRHSGKGMPGYNFSLPDTSHCFHRLSDYRSMVVVMDFWYTGCGNCKQLAPFLAKVEQSFTGKKVIFLTVSIDKDFSLWKRSILQGEYTSLSTLNLFTNGAGGEAPVITQNNIHGYPTLLVIDRQGKMGDSPIDPRLDGGSDLAAQIDHLLQETHY